MKHIILIMVTGFLGICFLTGCKPDKSEKGKEKVEWREDSLHRDVLHYEGAAGVVDIEKHFGFVVIKTNNFGGKNTRMEIELRGKMFEERARLVQERMIDIMGTVINNPLEFTGEMDFAMGISLPYLGKKDKEDEEDDNPPGGGSGGGGSGGFTAPSLGGADKMYPDAKGKGNSDMICVNFGTASRLGSLIDNTIIDSGGDEISVTTDEKTKETTITHSSGKDKTKTTLTFDKDGKLKSVSFSKPSGENGQNQTTYTVMYNQNGSAEYEFTTVDAGSSSKTHLKETGSGYTIDTYTYTDTNNKRYTSKFSSLSTTNVKGVKDESTGVEIYLRTEDKSGNKLTEKGDAGKYKDPKTNGPQLPSEGGTAQSEVCVPKWMLSQLLNWNELGDAVTYPAPHEGTGNDGSGGSGVGIGSLILLSDLAPVYIKPDPSQILDQRVKYTDPERH